MKKIKEIAAEIKELEEMLLQSDKRRSGDFLQKVLADEFVEFGSSRKVFSKKQIIKVLKEEEKVELSLSNF